MSLFTNADLISTYTRAQALEDGVLHDASALAREQGIVYPVALSANVWAECVQVPRGVACQSEPGRAWDVLTMLRHAMRHAPDGADSLEFDVIVRNRPDTDKVVATRDTRRLRAVVGPGDEGEPVITVLFPGED